MNHTNKSAYLPCQKPKEVVASIITYQGRVALFKRSHQVQGDQGLWHCITGFLDKACLPGSHIKVEIQEEAGIAAKDLQLIKNRKLLLDDSHGQTWCIYAYHFESSSRKLVTNWEHDDAIWCSLHELGNFKTVSWLSSIFFGLTIEGHISSRYKECVDALPMHLHAV